jgi:protein-S-isoprenylcysteine O-methyltransferase Ste14
MKEFIPGVLNGLAGLLSVGLSVLSPLRFPANPTAARTTGVLLIAAGLAFALWAATQIKSAIVAEVSPTLADLKQSGPYAIVRHPVYLGMTVALLGVALFTRSWPGALSVVFLFLPSALFRAHLEDLTLAKCFPGEWESYAQRVGFFLPRIRSGSE